MPRAFRDLGPSQDHSFDFHQPPFKITHFLWDVIIGTKTLQLFFVWEHWRRQLRAASGKCLKLVDASFALAFLLVGPS
jgi:hypothetical protein